MVLNVDTDYFYGDLIVRYERCHILEYLDSLFELAPFCIPLAVK